MDRIFLTFNGSRLKFNGRILSKPKTIDEFIYVPDNEVIEVNGGGSIETNDYYQWNDTNGRYESGDNYVIYSTVDNRWEIVYFDSKYNLVYYTNILGDDNNLPVNDWVVEKPTESPAPTVIAFNDFIYVPNVNIIKVSDGGSTETNGYYYWDDTNSRYEDTDKFVSYSTTENRWEITHTNNKFITYVSYSGNDIYLPTVTNDWEIPDSDPSSIIDGELPLPSITAESIPSGTSSVWVVDAGSTNANGEYIWDSNSNSWKLGLNTIEFYYNIWRITANQGKLDIITLYINQYDNMDSLPKENWEIQNGVSPPPTITDSEP